MKKWKKHLIIVSTLIIAMLFFKLCTNPELRIRQFVNRHEENLYTIAEPYLEGEKYFLGEYEIYKGVTVKGLQKEEHPVVEFFYSGKGIVPSGVYYGFYYSPDDVPVAIMDEGCLLTSVAQDEWEWNGYGDNGGRTKRIKENWFYYECWC